MIAIVGIHHRNHAHYTLCRSCLPIYGIAIIRPPSFLFLDDFERNANISVAITSDSTVDTIQTSPYFLHPRSQHLLKKFALSFSTVHYIFLVSISKTISWTTCLFFTFKWNNSQFKWENIGNWHNVTTGIWHADLVSNTHSCLVLA